MPLEYVDEGMLRVDAGASGLVSSSRRCWGVVGGYVSRGRRGVEVR